MAQIGEFEKTYDSDQEPLSEAQLFVLRYLYECLPAHPSLVQLHEAAGKLIPDYDRRKMDDDLDALSAGRKLIAWGYPDDDPNQAICILSENGIAYLDQHGLQ